MADISFLRNEDMEDTDEPMEGADDEETGGDGPADGRGDEGGGESPMTKLQQHASCNIPCNRQLVGRILVEVFRGAVESGTELNVDEVMQPVLKLVNDTEAAVRIDLVEQLPHVAMICQEAPDRLGDVLPRHLIQIIARFLDDFDQQVRQTTHAALLALIDRGLLDKASAEFVIAPMLLSMSQQIERLELFTLAIDGMSKVARILDEETADRLFLNRYLALCTDNNFFIRKLCAIRFGEFSAAMGKKAVYEKLLPMYVTLCKDPVWSVRKSCADVIVSFACCVSLKHRRTPLSKLLANFLTDDSKWVKVSAFQILGPFISTFAKQFTGFSYNQYGELVLTDQHGTELRYNVLSFAGTTEPPICKAVITSGQVLHFYEEDVNVVTKTNPDTSVNRVDTNDKENVPFNERSKTQWNSTSSLNNENLDNDATIIRDYDQFNPFRYYYIPPDLPLDTEIVKAAIDECTAKKLINLPIEESKDKSEENVSQTIEEDKTCEQEEEEEEKEEEEEEEPPTILSAMQTNVSRRKRCVIDCNTMSPSAQRRNSLRMSGKSKIKPNVDNSSKDETTTTATTTTTTTTTATTTTTTMTTTTTLSNDEKTTSNDVTTKTSTTNDETYDYAKNIASAQSTASVVAAEGFDFVGETSYWWETPDSLSEKMNNASVEKKERASSKIDHWANSGQTIVPHVLVNFFISMADPGAMSIGVEIPRNCAFSFPAVALTLGRENWPLLKKAYEELADAREYRVRRTMASSIHELAMILGEELTARDLLPIYDGFIKDLDEVRIGALKHLTTFLKVLRASDRQLFLPRLKAFLMMDNEWNWRFREEVASRLLEAIPLFSPNDVSDHIAQLSFPLLVDKVAAVRHTALALATQIIAYLSNDEHLVSTLLQDLKYLLATEPSKWTCRQTFALLCSSLIRNEAISPERFGRDMLPCLLSLSADVVPNVRLAVVTALSRHVINICDYLGVDQAEKVNQKLIEMQTDPDRDVRIVAGGVGGKYYPQGTEWKETEVKSKFSWQ